MNILTFDIEEWFNFFEEEDPIYWNKYEVRIHRNTEFIFETLENHQLSASFFCIGWIARKHPDIIRKIDSLGYEIGSHSNYHALAHQLDYAEFEEDLKTSIYSLEDVIGKKVRMYRAPGFSIKKCNSWVFEIMMKYGIEIDSSLSAVQSDTGGFENFDSNYPCLVKSKNFIIKEFPLNYVSWANRKLNFTGGGYFRLFPYKLSKVLFKHSLYNLVYFHPRDFDDTQPRLNAPLKRTIKNYIGLKGAKKKFTRLVKDFTFIDIRTAAQAISWDKVEIFDLNQH